MLHVERLSKTRRFSNGRILMWTLKQVLLVYNRMCIHHIVSTLLSLLLKAIYEDNISLQRSKDTISISISPKAESFLVHICSLSVTSIPLKLNNKPLQAEQKWIYAIQSCLNITFLQSRTVDCGWHWPVCWWPVWTEEWLPQRNKKKRLFKALITSVYVHISYLDTIYDKYPSNSYIMFSIIIFSELLWQFRLLATGFVISTLTSNDLAKHQEICAYFT